MSKSFIHFIITLIIAGLVIVFTLFKFNLDIHVFFEELVASNSVQLLQLFGTDYEVQNYAGKLHAIGFGNSGILRVESGCDGVDLLALYLAFALAFPGPWKHKAWYIPLGLILIHLFNVVRVAALVVIASYSVEVMEFNHKYTFLILVYSFVFLLWYFWIKQFALPNASKKALQG